MGKSRKSTGIKRKALLIGVRYVDRKGGETPNHLGGCWNDVDRIDAILKKYFNFKDSDITIMKDLPDNFDGELYPTRSNIRKKIKDLVKKAKEGDTLFISYSGHGTQIRDTNSDEKKEVSINSDTGKTDVSTVTGKPLTMTGKDEAICAWNGSEIEDIVDDDLHRWLVTNLKAGVTLRVFLDCCCSGSMFDLPYRFSCVEDSETLSNKGNKTSGQTDDIGWLEDLDNKDHRRKDSVDKDVLIISGCRDPESSMDATLDGVRYGALTYMVSKLVERFFTVQNSNKLDSGKVRAPRIFSWYTFIANLYLYVVKTFPTQNPQLSTTNKALLLQPIEL